MNEMKNYLSVLLLLFSALFLIPVQAQCSADDENCVPVNEWQFSIALGAGVISNPLHEGKNIPLVIIPSVSFYGERWFFDKNTLGYSFYPSANLIVSAISQPNRENAFFSRWHPSNIFVDSFSQGLSDFVPDKALEGEHTNTKVTVNISDVSKRKWALDGGIQLNWFLNNNTQVEAKLLHDLNNVYQGFNGQLLLSRNYAQHQQWHFNTTIGINWLSAAQVDYYYGIDWQDNLPSTVNHQGKSSFNPYFKLKARYQLNTQWSLVASVYRELIASNIRHSPLVKDKTIDTVFIGANYAF